MGAPTAVATLASSESTIVSPTQTLTGPIAKAAATQGIEWYLLGNGSLVASSNLVEPFPLPTSVQIRSLTQLNQVQADLLVAAQDGLYRRSAQSYRWQKISDQAAHFIAAAADGLWIAPDQADDQLWFSQDEGITWQPRSSGLTGSVQSAVHVAGDGTAWVITAQEQQLVLWKLDSGSETWTQVATLPDAAAAAQKFNLAVSFHLVNHAAGASVLVGASDGQLYQFTESGEWQSIYSFGDGTYPLLLGSDEVALVDVAQQVTHLYRGVRASADEAVPSKWLQLATPMVDLALGAQQIPDGSPLAHYYGWNDYAAAGFVAMALGEDGALYRFDLDPNTPQSAPSWRQVSKEPEHKEFIISHQGDETFGVFYSGASLRWNGATCTGEAKEFYRSDDQGASWTLVASDQARQPLMVLPGQPNTILAATCAGPALSIDGGVTWQEGAALQWPLESGAQLLEIRTSAAAVNVAPQWSAFYAGGSDSKGEPFLLRATFDATTATVGEWQSILPSGMKQPLALYATDTGNTVLPLGNEDDLYVADASGIWSSSDDGATWSTTPASVQGATVKALISFRPNAAESGLLAATDQGLFMGPLAGQTGDWQPLKVPFADQWSTSSNCNLQPATSRSADQRVLPLICATRLPLCPVSFWPTRLRLRK